MKIINEEFLDKTKENAIKCNRRYWRCEAYNCPLFTHCSAGVIDYITDFEVEQLFEGNEGE